MTLPKVLIAGLAYVYRWQEKSFPWGAVTGFLVCWYPEHPRKTPVTSGPPASELPLPISIIQYQSEGPCRGSHQATFSRQTSSLNYLFSLPSASFSFSIFPPFPHQKITKTSGYRQAKDCDWGRGCCPPRRCWSSGLTWKTSVINYNFSKL